MVCSFQHGRPSPHFSPRGEMKCVKGPSVPGARRFDVAQALSLPSRHSCRLLRRPPCRRFLATSVEHGEQAQRSNGVPIACFGRHVVRNAAETDLDRARNAGYTRRSPRSGWFAPSLAFWALTGSAPPHAFEPAVCLGGLAPHLQTVRLEKPQPEILFFDPLAAQQLKTIALGQLFGQRR
jgi:hypothetical protein